MPKYGPVKMLIRWYRRCVLLSAMDGEVLPNPYVSNGGSFTGPSFQPEYRLDPSSLTHDKVDDHWEPEMDRIVSAYLRELDALPHHFQMHLMHAIEILGYKHPDQRVRAWWFKVYVRLVSDLHLHPETEEEMDGRLGDNREGWLKRADPATTD